MNDLAEGHLSLTRGAILRIIIFLHIRLFIAFSEKHKQLYMAECCYGAYCRLHK